MHTVQGRRAFRNPVVSGVAAAGWGFDTRGLSQGGCARDEGLTPEGLGGPLSHDVVGRSLLRHTAGVGVAPHHVSPESRSLRKPLATTPPEVRMQLRLSP